MMKELIEEAREWSSSYASWGDNGLVDRLADALEAQLAARQPRESDRETLSQLIALGLDDTKNLGDWSQDYQDEMHQAADVILAAGFSRAAVPDAATEEHGNRIVKSLREAVRGERDGTTIPVPVEDCREIISWRSECDAALAAVERVRAVAMQHRSVEQHNEMVPVTDIADLIREPSSADYLAALGLKAIQEGESDGES